MTRVVYGGGEGSAGPNVGDDDMGNPVIGGTGIGRVTVTQALVSVLGGSAVAAVAVGSVCEKHVVVPPGPTATASVSYSGDAAT